MERDVRQRNRRRARAQRMKAIGEKRENGDETGDEELSVREKPPRPAHRRRKMREVLYEEDIIDGFAIAAFKTYSDLERAVKQAERRGLKTLEPLPPPGTTTSSARRRGKSSDGRTQGGGHSSGDGYFCDHSASDDGKVSDSGSDIFSSQSKRESPAPADTSTNGVVVTSPLTTAGTTCVTAPSVSRSLPSHQVVNGPRWSAPAGRGFLPHPGLATYPAPAPAPPPVPVPSSTPGTVPAPASTPVTVPDRVGRAVRPPGWGGAPASCAVPASVSPVYISTAAVTAAASSAASAAAGRRPPGLATCPVEPPTVGPPAPPPTTGAQPPAAGRARFAVWDLVSPSAAAAPVATAGPPPPGRNNGCSPAPATLPTASAAGRAKPPRHKATTTTTAPTSCSSSSGGSPAVSAAASSRRPSPALERQHPFSVASLGRLASGAGGRTPTAPSPLHSTPPVLAAAAAPARSPLSVGVFAPPPPPPLAAAGGLGLPPPPPTLPAQETANKTDLLRRELDTRFLASQDHAISVGPPPYLRGAAGAAAAAAELHQHHQAAPALLKSVPKLGSVNSPFFRTSSVPPMAGLSPMAGRPPAAPPFLPAGPLQLSTPKKTGRWNAMHVRIAWEIYKNQQKGAPPSQERPGIPPVSAAPGRPPGGSGAPPPPLTGAAHLRPPLMDAGQPAPPHPLAAAAFPRFPGLTAAVGGAFSGLLPPPPPGTYLDRHAPVPQPPSAAAPPFAALDSWGRFARPPVPTSGWPQLKPEPPLAAAPARPQYSPALEERTERRRAAPTPPRRDHSRSPLRLKMEPAEPRREHEERPRSADQKAAARYMNGVMPHPADGRAALFAAGAVRPPYGYTGLEPHRGAPPPLDPYQAALSHDALRETLERDRQLQLAQLAAAPLPPLYREQAAADQLAHLQSRELERLARDRQLQLDHKLLWGLHGPALAGGGPYGLRPPPPDSLHLVNSFKSPYPGGLPGLGPPLGPLAGCSSAPLRRLEPPTAPGLPRRDADLGR